MKSETSKEKRILLVGESTSIDHKAFVLEDVEDLQVKNIFNGFDALRAVLSENPPHLIIMDLLSEKINGLHFCFILAKLLEIQYTKVILFSEHSHRNNIVKGIQSGAADYIIDPCSDVLFKDRVLYHLYETPVFDGSTEEPESFKRKWKFLTFKRDKGEEQIFLEKIVTKGRSEIKKLVRDLTKKDFEALKLCDVTPEEFAFAKNNATGDLQRFLAPAKHMQEEVKQVEVPKIEEAEVKADKKEVYKAIEPKKQVSDDQLSGPIERDIVFDYSDLQNLAVNNDNLKILLDIDKEVSTNNDKRECIYNVIAQISKFIEMARASIIVPMGNSKVGQVLVSNDDKSLENLKINLTEYPEILESLKTGNIVFIEDVHKSKIMEKVISKLKHLEYSSIIVVPIWYNKKVIAVLSIRGKQGSQAINYEDIAYCQLIANAASRPIAGKLFLQKIMSKFIPRAVRP